MLASLPQLGFTHPITERMLHPGTERDRLLRFLLSRLVAPANLDSILDRLYVGVPAGGVGGLGGPRSQSAAAAAFAAAAQEVAAGRESTDEHELSYKCAMLLNSVGIAATADIVRGNTAFETNMAFLDKLSHTVLEQQQLSDPRHAHSGAWALDFACERFAAITSEAAPLFPSDITKLLHQYSTDAQGVLTHCQQHTQHLASHAERIQQDVELLAQEAITCAPDEWEAQCSDVQLALEEFLGDAQAFIDVYEKELRVWCEHLQAPLTHGFGQQAAAMLEAYTKLWRVLNSVSCIRRMHAAVAASQPPLQAYQPEELRQVAQAGQQEVAKLAREVEVLARAAQRQRAAAAAPARPWASALKRPSAA